MNFARAVSTVVVVGTLVFNACGGADQSSSVGAGGRATPDHTANRPAGFSATSIAIPPFNPGASATVIGTEDHLLLFGSEGRLLGARFGDGRWTDLPTFEAQAAGVVESTSGDLFAVGLSCPQGQCDVEGEVVIGRLRLGSAEWQLERTGRSEEAEFFAAGGLGEATNGDVLFQVGPHIWAVSAAGGYRQEAEAHLPFKLCVVDGALASVEPGPQSVSDDDISTPRFDGVVLRTLSPRQDAWSEPTTPPEGLRGVVAPACVAGGVALVGEERTATWRSGRWTVANSAPRGRLIAQRLKAFGPGLVGLADDGLVVVFDEQTGWRARAHLRLREPHLAVTATFAGRIFVLDPGPLQANEPRILEVG